jgi:hypothetical protein
MNNNERKDQGLERRWIDAILKKCSFRIGSIEPKFSEKGELNQKFILHYNPDENAVYFDSLPLGYHRDIAEKVGRLPNLGGGHIGYAVNRYSPEDNSRQLRAFGQSDKFGKYDNFSLNRILVRIPEHLDIPCAYVTNSMMKDEILVAPNTPFVNKGERSTLEYVIKTSVQNKVWRDYLSNYPD